MTGTEKACIALLIGLLMMFLSLLWIVPRALRGERWADLVLNVYLLAVFLAMLLVIARLLLYG